MGKKQKRKSRSISKKVSRKIDTPALALSVAITSALGIISLGLVSISFGMGTELVNLISGLYIGFNSTIEGIIIGGIWAFIDGLIFGALIGYFYNQLVK